MLVVDDEYGPRESIAFTLGGEFAVGTASFPDGRRLEFLAEPLADEVKVRAMPEAESLRAALLRCAAVHRRLVTALLGDAWRWPERSGLRLGGE